MDERISGWWVIGEAPNYEVNDEGQVRHIASGRAVRHRQTDPNHAPHVILSSYGKTIKRRVQDLVESGRKYQER